MATVPDANPYDPNILGYNSILALFAQQQHRANLLTKLVGSAALVIIALLLIALVGLAGRHPATYALVIDSRTQHVDMAELTRLDGSAPYRDLVVHGLLPKILTYAFSITDSGFGLNLTENVNPYILGASTAQHALATFITSVTPPAGSNAQVTVVVDNRIRQQPTGAYLIGFTLTTIDGSGTVLNKTHYLAAINIGWYPPNRNNIPGMYLTNFTIDSQAALR